MSETIMALSVDVEGDKVPPWLLIPGMFYMGDSGGLLPNLSFFWTREVDEVKLDQSFMQTHQEVTGRYIDRTYPILRGFGAESLALIAKKYSKHILVSLTVYKALYEGAKENKVLKEFSGIFNDEAFNITFPSFVKGWFLDVAAKAHPLWANINRADLESAIHTDVESSLEEVIVRAEVVDRLTIDNEIRNVAIADMVGRGSVVLSWQDKLAILFDKSRMNEFVMSLPMLG